MRYFLSFTAILCLLSFQLLGCSEDSDRPTTETPEPEAVAVNPNIVEPQIPLTPEAVFQQLQNEFAGRLENPGNFEGLRAATTSPVYLDYLAEAFPIAERVQSLEAYFQTASPDPERYTPFLLEWVGVATEEDISAIHELTTSRREGDFWDLGDREEQGQGIEALLAELKPILVGMFGELPEFEQRHQLPVGSSADRLDAFSLETQRADATWLHEQMVAHGTDAGLLWAAIHSPALMGEILYGFNETAVFLQWVETTRTTADEE